MQKSGTISRRSEAECVLSSLYLFTTSYLTSVFAPRVARRRSFQTCIGVPYCGVDWESVRIDTGHGCPLSDRAPAECGLSHFQCSPFLLRVPSISSSPPSLSHTFSHLLCRRHAAIRLVDVSSISCRLYVFLGHKDIYSRYTPFNFHYIVLTSRIVFFFPFLRLLGRRWKSVLWADALPR